MPRFSANISMLFTEHPLLDRFAAAADAGFGAVEIQFPYDDPAEILARAIEDAGVGLSVMNFPVGDMLDGGTGLAAIPGQEAAFAVAIDTGKAVAQVLSPRCLNVLAGFPPDAVLHDACFSTLAANLRRAATAMEGSGARITVEALNDRDRPGYFLTTSAAALEVLDAADHTDLGFEYDIYHMYIMEGALVPTLERIAGRIGNIQFADAPGRNEPGTGEIDFPLVFDAIDRIGYDGWVGAEYVPSKRTEETLGWLKPYI